MGVENINDIDHEGGGSSAAEQNDEQFRDSYKVTQQQVAAIKAAEKRAHAKDDQLAKVLQRFLASSTDADLMMLIAGCLGHNIAAGLILGLLALIEPEAMEEFKKMMGESVLLLAAPAAHEHALVTAQHFDAAHLPPHVKISINNWAKGILEFSFTQPTRVLATAVSPEGVLYPSLSLLAATILARYLASQGITAAVTSTQPFTDLIIRNVIEKIRERMGGMKELGEGK